MSAWFRRICARADGCADGGRGTLSDAVPCECSHQGHQGFRQRASPKALIAKRPLLVGRHPLGSYGKKPINFNNLMTLLPITRFQRPEFVWYNPRTNLKE